MRWAELEEELRDHPNSFSFFQAVRILERLHPTRVSVGHFVDPATEVVRFSVNPSISFPPSEIHELDLPEEGGGGMAEMLVNFMGATGPVGVLPYHYTLLIAERKRARDHSLAEFLDLFHHRIISLFYRAWEKHRFTIALEKGTEDRLEEHLRDLLGIALQGHRERLSVPDNALIFHGGLLGMQQRGALALEQLLEDYFGVQVEVEQFVGGWFPLPTSDQCALGEEDPSTQLGRGAVAGDEVWDQQARVRIRLGPLTREQFDRFLPTGSAYPALRSLTRFFANDQFEFEVQLVLARDEVPGFVLGNDAAQPLGWSTWIRSGQGARDADETILRL